MRVLQVSARESQGGAAVSAFRLHKGLQREGVRSQMLVGRPDLGDPDVFAIDQAVAPFYTPLDRFADRLGRRIAKSRGLPYDRYRSTRHIPETGLVEQADLIHFHNLHGNYFDLRSLPAFAAKKPLVWTLHDMWAFTGHCAYSYGCDRWQAGCHHCPLYAGDRRDFAEPPLPRMDRSRPTWLEKREIFRRTPVQVVTPSDWLRRMAETSILQPGATFRTIPYGIDLDVFRPVERGAARDLLEIPAESKVILFAAEDAAKKRKGLALLLKALDGLREESDQPLFLLTLGDTRNLGDRLDGFPARSLGFVHDEKRLRTAFAAADVFVSPTLADNLPVVLIEALACGTPAVAFNVGGVPEIIDHMQTGYLAELMDVADLRRGIAALLDDPGMLEEMAARCRRAAEERFSLSRQARAYIALYEEALAGFQPA